MWFLYFFDEEYNPRTGNPSKPTSKAIPANINQPVAAQNRIGFKEKM